jgi:hypothetical protein
VKILTAIPLLVAGEGETAPFPCHPIPKPKNKPWSFTQKTGHTYQGRTR